MATSIRSTMRVSLVNLEGANPPEQKDTVYYIKTETPHLGEFSAFGPFRSLEAMLPSLKTKLAQISPPSLEFLVEYLSTGKSLTGLGHITCPLDDGKTTIVDIVEEMNPEVAAILPGPCWRVIACETTKTALLNRKADQYPRMKAFIIHGSFVSADKAREAARELLEEKCQGMKDGKVMKPIKANGREAYCVASKKFWMIEMNRDLGIEYFDEERDGEMTPSDSCCSHCRKHRDMVADGLELCGSYHLVGYCSKVYQKEDWRSISKFVLGFCLE